MCVELLAREEQKKEMSGWREREGGASVYPSSIHTRKHSYPGVSPRQQKGPQRQQAPNTTRGRASAGKPLGMRTINCICSLLEASFHLSPFLRASGASCC